jgi:flagellar biosynthesis/type III secretory pathway chaperone
MDMTEFFAELVKLLQTETVLYRRLLDIMDRERAAMLRSRRKDIEDCVAEKRELLARLQTIERQRTALVQQLAQRIGCSPAEVSLSLLARTSPAPHGAELRHCRIELLELMARVQEENWRSEALCRQTVELLRAACGVVKGLAANRGCVYHQGGRLHAAHWHGRLVCDEI